MNTRQIEYMLALWEEKSFTKAAKRLYITPSALNQQLRHLEKELGTALFERNGHSFSLTPSGKIYMSGARNIMNIKEQAMKQINAIHSGVPWISSIRIALHQNFYRFFMDYIYPDFTQKYPSVELSPIIVTDTSARMEVEKQDADLAYYCFWRLIFSSWYYSCTKRRTASCLPKSPVSRWPTRRTISGNCTKATSSWLFIHSPSYIWICYRILLKSLWIKAQYSLSRRNFRHLAPNAKPTVCL